MNLCESILKTIFKAVLNAISRVFNFTIMTRAFHTFHSRPQNPLQKPASLQLVQRREQTKRVGNQLKTCEIQRTPTRSRAFSLNHPKVCDFKGLLVQQSV